MYIAFYKGNKHWYSILIKLWTNSQYSHCELYDGNFLIGVSSKYKRVRKQPIKLDREKWDVYCLVLRKEKVENFFQKTKGKPYDWKGILFSQVLNLRKQDKEKYTCSEWIAELLDSEFNCFYPKRYANITPEDLHELITKGGNNDY